LSHYQGADELNFIITEHATAHEVRQACRDYIVDSFLAKEQLRNAKVKILAGPYDDNRFDR